MAKKNGKMTLDKLARMMERGFAEVATKKELNDFRAEVDDRFKALDNKFDSITQILRFMQEDNKRWRENIETEILDLQEKVSHLQRKVGMRK